MRTTVLGAIGALLLVGAALPAAAQGYYDAGGPPEGYGPPCPCPGQCPEAPPHRWGGPPPGWGGPPPAGDDGYAPGAFEDDGGVGVGGGYAGYDEGPDISFIGGGGNGLWIHGRGDDRGFVHGGFNEGFRDHERVFAHAQASARVSEQLHLQTHVYAHGGVSYHSGGGHWSGSGSHWGGGGRR